MEDKQDQPKKRVPVDISEQLITELDALLEAEARTVILTEKDFPERKFPIRWNPNKEIWYERVWDEGEVRKFYEDPENISRTIYCKEVNVDELDDWGMFGYTPGFVYIEKVNYKGSRTLADKAASLGLVVAVDPKSGLGIMNHFDYFPKHKFDYTLIRRENDPKLYALMCDIFRVRKLEGERVDNNPLLKSGKESV